MKTELVIVVETETRLPPKKTLARKINKAFADGMNPVKVLWPSGKHLLFDTTRQFVLHESKGINTEYALGLSAMLVLPEK